MNMSYDQEPFYGHLKFLLSVPLLEQELTPSDCVFNRIVAENIEIVNSFGDLDCEEADAINHK
jgi:hypothetical protein